MVRNLEMSSGEEKAKLCAARRARFGARVRKPEGRPQGFPNGRPDGQFGKCITHIRQTVFYGEFDSGSERTLAAWIRHASRTRKHGSLLLCSPSGARVSNT